MSMTGWTESQESIEARKRRILQMDPSRGTEAENATLAPHASAGEESKAEAVQRLIARMDVVIQRLALTLGKGA